MGMEQVSDSARVVIEGNRAYLRYLQELDLPLGRQPVFVTLAADTG
jgi:hypothetical protein